MKSNLSNVKVGDWVCTCTGSWQKVTRRTVAGDVYVRVVGLWFDISGMHGQRDIYPTCFAADQVPQPYLELFGPPPAEFKEGDAVLVAHTNDSSTIWIPRIFKKMRAGRYVVYWEGDKQGDEFRFCKHWSPPNQNNVFVNCIVYGEEFEDGEPVWVSHFNTSGVHWLPRVFKKKHGDEYVVYWSGEREELGYCFRYCRKWEDKP